MRFRILYRTSDGDWHSRGSILFPEAVYLIGRQAHERLSRALEGIGLYAGLGDDVVVWNAPGCGVCSFTIYDSDGPDGEPIIVGAGQTIPTTKAKKDSSRKKVLAVLNRLR